MKTTNNSKKSNLPKVLAIVAGVVVLGVGAYFAWQALGKTAEEKAMEAATAEMRAECEKANDKDICKFLSNWKASEQYRMVSASSDGGQMTFEIDGDKSRMVTTGDYAMEVITIGDTTYTKSGDIWYKQTLKPEQDPITDAKPDFSEPADENEADTTDKTVYKSHGKEACGDLTCFKYEVVDAEASDTQEFIWFDDRDYKLRKTLTQMSDGSSTEATYEYSGVSISEPTPVRELGPNQYIVPGQTEPMTMPEGSDYGIQ